MSASPSKLGSLLTAMLTPFDANDRVDLREAARLATFLVDQGNDGLVVCGTTGESPSLSDDETIALFEATKKAVGERATIVAGTGSNNTRHAIDMTKRAEAAGVDAILSVVPYYSKPTQTGMLAHFGAIAESTSLPVVIYNIPHRTGVNMVPATLLELAKRHANVAGVKESSGDFAQFTEILRERPSGFGFWSGDDHLLLPSLAIGGDGLISVAAHVCAGELRELIESYRSGEVARAAHIHQELGPLFAALFATSSPIPVKWAMNELGFSLGACRLPLGTMPDETAARLGPLLERYRARFPAAVASG